MTKLYLEHLSEYAIVAADVETTGVHFMKDSMFGIAIAAWDDAGIASGYWDLRENPRIIEILKDQLPKCKHLVNHSAKFDAHFLRKAGVRVPIENFECTMVRAALINENEHSFSLDNLCKKYIGRGKAEGIYEKLAAMFGGQPTREAQMKNLHRAPESLVREYATPDPELAILLWQWQEEQIEDQHLHKIWALERELTPALIEIEEHGVRVDEELAHHEWKALEQKIDNSQEELDRIGGRPGINANSPKQMRELFGCENKGTNEKPVWFTKSGFQCEITETGQPSIGKDALETMANLGDDRAKAVMRLRKFTKARSFLKDHIIGHAINGRVYPNYNQTRGETGLGTGTGRLSIDDPALQQIPARDKDIAAIVRSCFLPDEGHDWSCADWEQFEFRWFAHYTNDETIIKAYADDPDTDYHAIVSKITGIPRNATHAGAANAKQINLGLVFGMGQGELAFQMGMPYTTRRDEFGREWKNAGPEAKAIFSTYHSSIPGVKQTLDRASSIARARGYVKTAMERHIRFPGGKFTHKAAGLVFQGTSADSMKVKMIALHNMGKRLGFNYLLSVHDENNTSIPDVRMNEEIKRELETFDGRNCPIECRVPIRCSIKSGANWWQACKKEK